MVKTARAVAPGVVVAVCFLIAAVEGYDIQAFGVAAPRLVPELGLDSSQQGWAASAAMIGLVLGAFAGGWLADRTGRKPVLIASVIGFGLCSIWTALSHDYETLLAARFITGLGFGGAMPNLIAVAAEISRPERRGATVSAMFCGMPAGGAAVALAARLWGEALDWRMIFVAGGVLPLLLVPVIVLLLPETRPAAAPAADRRLLPALFAGGRAVPTLLLWAANILTLVILYLMLNWLPTLVVAKGLPPADGAAASLAFNIVGVAGALALGVVTDRLGHRWTLAAAYAGLAVAILALSRAEGAAAVLTLSAAAGFLVLGAQYALYALAPMLYGPSVRAAGAGAAVGVGRFGSIIGPLLAGELRHAGWAAGQVIDAMAPLAVGAGLAVVVLTMVARLKAD
ncbi:MFS transporter [Phenylobacterium sp.]|jgi:AAHS family 3-hydroxyphenylpropionic acid transporter|uniref:MFS transporter n=1 Tax=Phenylobacterium sp. TaxID=1871053 RepID=UPI002F94B457